MAEFMQVSIVFSSACTMSSKRKCTFAISSLDEFLVFVVMTATLQYLFIVKSIEDLTCDLPLLLCMGGVEVAGSVASGGRSYIRIMCSCRLAWYTFLPRCMQCRRGLAMRFLSVRPSVRPSVCLSVRPSVCQTRAL